MKLLVTFLSCLLLTMLHSSLCEHYGSDVHVLTIGRECIPLCKTDLHNDNRALHTVHVLHIGRGTSTLDFHLWCSSTVAGHQSHCLRLMGWVRSRSTTWLTSAILLTRAFLVLCQSCTMELVHSPPCDTYQFPSHRNYHCHCPASTCTRNTHELTHHSMVTCSTDVLFFLLLVLKAAIEMGHFGILALWAPGE